MLFLLSPYQELCRCTRTKSLIVYHLPSVWLRKVVPHSKLIHHSELPAPHEFMMAAKLGWTPWRNLLSIGEFFFSLVFPTLLLFPPFSWLNVHTVHVPFPLKTTTVLISCLGIPPPLLCVNYFSYLNWSIPSRLRSTRRSLSPEPPSLSDPMAPLIDPWRNRTLQVTERRFLLWLYPPPVLHCLHEHNALARSQTTAKLFHNIALLPYVPLSPHLMFVYLYLVLSHVRAAVAGIPPAVQICSTSSAPFPLQSRPVPVGWQHTTARLFESPISLYLSRPNMMNKCWPVRTKMFLQTSNWQRCLGDSGLKMRGV